MASLSLLGGLARANTATAPHGMVAAVNPIATDAGVDAMKNGGNAIDAAIATALTLGKHTTDIATTDAEGDLARRTITDIRNHPHPNPLPKYREREPDIRV